MALRVGAPLRPLTGPRADVPALLGSLPRGAKHRADRRPVPFGVCHADRVGQFAFASRDSGERLRDVPQCPGVFGLCGAWLMLLELLRELFRVGEDFLVERGISGHLRPGRYWRRARSA
jgi:hypothetical protein